MHTLEVDTTVGSPPRIARRSVFLSEESGFRKATLNVGCLVVGAKPTWDETTADAGQLRMSQAVVVLFCTSMGGAIPMVAWFPTMSGYFGFVVAMVIVVGVAVVAESAIMRCAERTSAVTFTELCLELPPSILFITEVASVIWALNGVALYTVFVHSFLFDQVCPGADPSTLFLVVGFFVFLVTLPTRFSGTVSNVINAVNLGVSLTVVFVAFLTGLYVWWDANTEDPCRSFQAVQPSGVLPVAVLLAGPMVQCGCVPLLNHNIRQADRSRATFVVPSVVALAAGAVYSALGFVGYFAVGNAIVGDTFKVYASRPQIPGWITFVLRGGVATLMYLSCPLVFLPGKAQLYALLFRVGRETSYESSTSNIGTAPILHKMCLNAGCILFTTLVTWCMGFQRFMTIHMFNVGIFANWLNIFLPGFVVLFTTVLPARVTNTMRGRDVATAGLLLVFASASFLSSVLNMGRLLIFGMSGGAAPIGSCRL